MGSALRRLWSKQHALTSSLWGDGDSFAVRERFERVTCRGLVAGHGRRGQPSAVSRPLGGSASARWSMPPAPPSHKEEKDEEGYCVEGGRGGEGTRHGGVARLGAGCDHCRACATAGSG